MSVFDSILDGISSLGDWVDSNSDLFGDVTDLAKTGLKAYGTLNKNAEKRGEYAQNNLMRYAALRGTKNNVDPGEADYGLKNYAPSPQELEAYWGQTLQKFVQTSQTGVSPYKVGKGGAY